VTVAGVAALMVGVAACGSSSSSSSASKSSGSSTPSSAAATTTAAAASSVQFSSIERTVPDTYPQPQPKKLGLGYLNPAGSRHEFLTVLGKSMRLETQKLGGTYVEKDAEGDVNKQVSQFDQLIAQKVNGIAVFALDPKSLAPDVARARAAGIHLVTIDLNF